MKYVGHSEYGRKSLDNYSTAELQAEVERRERKDRIRRNLDQALEFIANRKSKAEVIERRVYGSKRIYTIEVN